MDSVTVSAPGKVLILGGYLVLDPQYRGTVITTTARVHVTAQVLTDVDSSSEGAMICLVRSDQFRMLKKLEWRCSSQTLHNIQDNYSELDVNDFIGTSLKITLQYLSRSQIPLPPGISIIVQADNDFYSQRDHLKDRGLMQTSDSLATLPKFLPPLDGCSIKKTGLGSSAALVTAVVDSVVSLLNPMKENHLSDGRLEEIHNIAQIAHSLAQGKVGSGFDISAAVYGSHIYGMSTEARTNVENRIIEMDWGMEREPFHLCKYMNLLCGDVSHGSHTPSMVSKVLKSEEAKSLWPDIGMLNYSISQKLLMLCDYESSKKCQEFLCNYERLSETNLTEWRSFADRFSRLHVEIADEFLKVRALLRRMGDIANVPVEPAEQTVLLDSCMELPGVLACGVPGAGGYDAVFVICLSQQVRKRVEEHWARYKPLDVSPLLLTEDSEGIHIL